jgi:phosphoglycolate phosphatase
MMHIAAIAFDLDGTLLDSAAGVADALNIALDGAGLRGFELPIVRSWIGDGPDALILRALTACQSTGGLRDVDLPPLAAQLRRRFDAATLADPKGDAYDGIAELLERLGTDYPLVVVTNKPTPLARAVLGAAGLIRHFAAVHGADSPAQRKPSPLLIQQAAAQLGISPHSVLMVGDGPADQEAAHAASSPFVWVSWGYGQRPVMPAMWQLDAPHELLAKLQATQRAPIH